MPHDEFAPDRLREAYQHMWFVVARSCDVGDGPVAAQLLDRKLTVFRDSSGAARVTDQRCVHRGANLSDGVVVGDSIRCPYHGWQFDGRSGTCTAIPSLAEGGRIPPKAAIKAYPVVERFEHIWTCLGDPVFDIPNPPEIQSLDLTWRAGPPIHAECGFMAATENFRDMAHFPFVHGKTMGDIEHVVPDLEVNREGREVWSSYFYKQVPDSEYSDVGDAMMHYHSYAPGMATILFDLGQIGKRYLVDFPSPVSYDKCVIYWGVAADAGFTGGTVDEVLALETDVFNEDTPVLEGLDPKEVPLAGQAVEVSAPADIYTLNYRRAAQHAVKTIQAARGLDDASSTNGAENATSAAVQ